MKTTWVLVGVTTAAVLIGTGYWAGGKSPSPAPPSAEAASTKASSLPIAEASPPTVKTLPLNQGEQDKAIAQGELIDSLFEAGSRGSPEMMTPVYAALRHADPEVREAAASVLLQYAGEEALPHLRAALTQAATDEETSWLKEAIEFISSP